MSTGDRPLPRARDEGVLIEDTGIETVVYDVERKEAHALSPLAAGVFAYSDGRRSLSELAVLTADRIGEPVTEAQVADALAVLEEHHLLAAPEGGVSRRSFVRRSAAVAISVPLVTSVVLPATVLAASEPGCALSQCTPDSARRIGHHGRMQGGREEQGLHQVRRQRFRTIHTVHRIEPQLWDHRHRQV